MDPVRVAAAARAAAARARVGEGRSCHFLSQSQNIPLSVTVVQLYMCDIKSKKTDIFQYVFHKENILNVSHKENILNVSHILFLKFSM